MAGVNYTAATDEPSDFGNNATSASHSSESLSPPQRNILLSLSAETHTAAAAAATAAGSFGKITVTEACDASGAALTKTLVLLVCLIYLPHDDYVFSLQTKYRVNVFLNGIKLKPSIKTYN